MTLPEQPGPATEHPNHPVPDEHLRIDPHLISTLAAHYSNYHQALTRPLDPVRVLTHTGQILRTVKEILTAIGHAPQRTTTRGLRKPRPTPSGQRPRRQGPR